MRTKTKANLAIELMVMVVLLGTGLAYAAASGPALQVTGYSTTPASVYPGTTGQLQLTLANGGTDTATRIAVYYDNGPGGANSIVNVGDIGVGGTTLASVPFVVPNDVTSGILVIHMSIVYADSSGTSSQSTPATVSIPLLQHQVLGAGTVSVSGTSIQPGDGLTATIELENTGGVTRSVVIRSAENSSFSLEGSSQLSVGDIATNSSRNVTVGIISSSSAAAGRYMVPLTVQYQDAVQNTVTETIYVGPISVTDASAQFALSMDELTPAEVGSQAQFNLVVENRGASTASAIIDLNVSSVFTPIGNSRIYADNIPAGGNYTQEVLLGVEPAASAGYYQLPIVITGNGKSSVQNIGIPVEASQQITVSVSTQPAFVSPGSSGVVVTAEIANTGNSPIRSVYASVSPSRAFETVGASDKFVGTLNVDDFTSFQFTVNVPGSAQPGNYTLPVKIVFKDSTNQEHTVVQNIPVEVYSPSDAFRLGSLGNSTGGTRFGGRGGSGGGFFGISLLTPLNIGMAVVALLIGYFAYGKLKGSKK